MRDMGLILNILFAQVFIFIGTFLMGLISSHVSLYMSTRIKIRVLSDYLTKLLKLPMTFFDTKSVGDYQQRLGDHGRLQGFVTYSTLQTFFSIISVPFYLVIIGWWQIQIEKNIRLKTAKKERDLPISENRNVSSRLCRKPAFDGNGKTFSFAYVIIGGWLSAFMSTTKRRS